MFVSQASGEFFIMFGCLVPLPPYFYRMWYFSFDHSVAKEI